MRRLTAATLIVFGGLQATPALGQQQPVQAPQVSAATRTEVLTFVRAYVDAHNRADATSLSDAISRRPDVTSVGYGTITRGWDAIRTETDQITGKEGMFRLSIGTIDLISVGPAHVLVVAPTAVTVSTQTGPVQSNGAMTLLLEKGGDGWKILNEHFSTKMP